MSPSVLSFSASVMMTWQVFTFAFTLLVISAEIFNIFLNIHIDEVPDY